MTFLTALSVSGNQNKLEELNQPHSEGIEEKEQASVEVVMIDSDDHGDDGNLILDDNPQNKIWYYMDQSDKVQGPFSMSMLKGWKTKGWFASDFRVWKVGQTKEAAILLTDAISQSI
ncbi:hypothetical protein MKW92_051435 [Papaver armeniacum]|nr:hypothetical protein MKW92_051435 [Papaver armeniacum]